MISIEGWLELLLNGTPDDEVARMLLRDLSGDGEGIRVTSADIGRLLALLTAVRLHQLSKSEN